MSVYLVQHGKSFSKDEDPEKKLTPEGISEVERIANVAKGYSVRVSRIIHSGKARARQTAEIFAASLSPESGVHEMEGLGPLDDVEAFAQRISNSENPMVVGHLPFMEKLTAHLIAGRTEPPVFKFQNGGIVCLDRFSDAWVIKWTLMPNIG